MNFGSRGRLAATAGLAIALTLSPAAGPVVTALAETTDNTAEGQSIDMTQTVVVNFRDAEGNLIGSYEEEVPIWAMGGMFDFRPTVGDFVDQLKAEYPGVYDDAAWHWALGDAVDLGSKLGYGIDSLREYNFYLEGGPVEEAAVTVYFEMNYPDGASGEGQDYSVEASEAGYIAAPSDPTCEGYRFLGWARDGRTDIPLLTSQSVGNQKYPVESGDVTYVAQWEKAETEEPGDQDERTVRFVAFDPTTGEQGLDYTVPNDDQESAVVVRHIPDVPEYEGFEFVGWLCTEGVYEGELFQSGELLYAAVPVGSVFAAQYEESDSEEPVTATHRVTFDDCLPSTENQVVEVEDGRAVARPEDPVCEGYVFLGWYADTALTREYDFSAPVTEDMTLWAKWEKVADGTPADGSVQNPTKPVSDDVDENDGLKSDELPQTGDATVAVSGIAALGASAVGIGALLRRRR